MCAHQINELFSPPLPLHIEMDGQTQTSDDEKSEASKPNQMNDDDSDDESSQNDKDNT